MVHEGKWEEVTGTTQFLRSYDEVLAKTHKREEKGMPNGKAPVNVNGKPEKIRPAETWEPPLKDWIKINVDGAYDSSGKAGIGVVIRKADGSVLLTAWRVVFNGTSAEEVEALACKEGISLEVEWAKGRAIVESDCLTLIQKLRDRGPSISELCFVLDDIWSLGDSMPEIVFQAVRRERNRVAHELAQLAKKTTHTAGWRGRAPVCVEQLIAQECNPIIE